MILHISIGAAEAQPYSRFSDSGPVILSPVYSDFVSIKGIDRVADRR